MDLQLKNKTALVTGSTAGIGYSIAKFLAKEGVITIINGRTPERVAKAIQNIKSECPSAQLIAAPADLSEVKGIETLINQISSVDILINNFGIYQVKPFTDITDSEWLQIFNSNVMSGIRLSRHYLPAMLKQDWGRIIFISSESGLQIPAEMVHYGMTKTAQLAVARGMAESIAGTKVTVNSVLPGPTNSEGVKDFIETLSKQQHKSKHEIENEFFNVARPTSLLKRFITTDEVASMVAFLCSPLAAGTNGSAIRVDGGVVKSIA